LTIYDVEIIGSPTDMYGNSFNIFSYPGAWGFQTNSTALGAGTWAETNVTDVGYEGYMVRAVSTGNDFDYLAVAREGGVDFYDTSTIPSQFAKVAYSLPISSKVTDMKYTYSANAGNDNLLISTISDGVYRVTFLNITLSSASDFNVTRYLESETGIYGVDFGLDGNNFIDKIYAVGPTMGLKVLNLDTNGSLTTTDSIAIDGSPLRVLSYTYSLAALIRHVYVSDYEHGVWSFDENGTSQVDTNITASVKYIFKVNDTLADLVYGLSAVGNYQYINAQTPGAVTETASTLSSVSDVLSVSSLSAFIYGSGALITMPDKGVMTYDPYYMTISNLNLLKPSIGQPVSTTVVNGSNIVVLTKEGKLHLFQAF
jgi:hypothetical protein